MTTRSIPWPRILAEGVAIVVSILLAFGIQAWWEGQQERARIEASLVNIAAEIEAGQVEIQGTLATNRGRAAMLGAFFRLAPDQVLGVATDTLLPIGRSITRPASFDFGGAALESLMSSGDLALIQDSDLRALFVSWQRLPDEAGEDFELALQAFTDVQPHMSRHGVPQALYSHRPGEEAYGAPSIQEALAAMRRDTEAVGALIQLQLWLIGYSSELSGFLPLADSLLARLPS